MGDSAQFICTTTHVSAVKIDTVDGIDPFSALKDKSRNLTKIEIGVAMRHSAVDQPRRPRNTF